MSHIQTEVPSTRRLLKATAIAIAVAGVILVTTVLPAEYGIDPTGVGGRLGLDVLASSAEAAEPEPVATAVASAPDRDATNAALAAKAVAAFGKSEGQSLDAQAVALSVAPMRRDSLSITLLPGKGAEVKAHLKSGNGLVFHWSASSAVAVDMHGERTGAKNAWTSYAVETEQREAAGTFTAPFEGSHGWYWQNRGTEPVTVQIEVTGFQADLYRP